MPVSLHSRILASGYASTIGEWVAITNWEPSQTSSWMRLSSVRQFCVESAASGSSSR